MTAGTQASINRTARSAGALYLALMPFGFFGFMYVPSVLVVSGDAATTSRNIMTSGWLFRSGIVSSLISQIIFIFLVLALHRLLKPVNKEHAMLMVVLGLLAVPIAFLNEVNHLAALRLLTSANDGAFTTSQLQAQAMLFLDMRKSGILITLAFWGLWLVPLGVLVFKSGFLPRVLGVLLVIAGAGYVLDVATQLVSTGLPTIGQFTFVGEVLLTLWLLIRGVNVERWREVGARAASG
jgi:hypothetical protein